MSAIAKLAETRPFAFVVVVFLAENAIALPFVAVFNLLQLDLVPLRLIIPIAQSVFMIGLIWHLGWFERAGFTSRIDHAYVYWYPVLLAFVPVLLYGSIDIDSGWVSFYLAALLFTGISEEAFARGIALPALQKTGKWVALFFAATLFSVGHFTNLFFEDFGLLEMTEKLLSTFGFAILYGAVFIRTRNIWPLIVLHMIHDYMFLTSGTAGPFAVEPIAIEVSIALSVANIVYGVYIARKANWYAKADAR